MIPQRLRPPDLEARLARLGEALGEDGRVRFAYLFGSLARGRATPISDVDVAVHLTEGVPPAEAKLDLIRLVSGVLDMDEVDVVLLDTAPIALSYRIVQDRVVLCDKDPAGRARFESLALRKGWDFLPRERKILEQRYGLGPR